MSERVRISAAIRKRLVDLRAAGECTSKGEPLSFASIGRTLEPPVHRVSVYKVVNGERRTARIRKAIEKELRQVFWREGGE